MLRVVKGDIFECEAAAFVNPVNCVGVMGAGLAREFRRRCPLYFEYYKRVCGSGLIVPGRVDVFNGVSPWIVSFPTKRHWRDRSILGDVVAGLEHMASLPFPGVVAVPALGCGLGGLDWSVVLGEMEIVLEPAQVEFCVYEPIGGAK